MTVPGVGLGIDGGRQAEDLDAIVCPGEKGGPGTLAVGADESEVQVTTRVDWESAGESEGGFDAHEVL